MIGPGELSQLDWRNPWWLALALQPWLTGWLLRARRDKIYRYADAHLLPWAMRGSLGATSGKWRNLASMLAWLLLACAAAGPRLPLLTTPEQQAAIPRHEINLMIVLDVSPSMLAEDVSPQRLQRAKLELLDLLPRLRGERIGLIVFSGNAGLLMPLSRDEAALRYYLTLAEPRLFEVPGSNVGAALDLARQSLLAQGAGQHGTVLLLTDGDSSALSAPMLSAARTAAGKLQQAGLPLYVMGIGTRAGATIPQTDGGVLEHDGAATVSRLDETYLTALARVGGGKYTGVQDGGSDWNALYDNGILTLPGNRHTAEPAQAWQELYAWCLLPAWLLLLYVYFPLNRLGSRPDIAGWLLAGMLGYSAGMPTAHADDTGTARAAYTAYRSGNYVEAQALYASMQGYAAAMGSGATAYRRQNYAEAIRQFTTAMLSAHSPAQCADALYNLGNSYFAAGSFGTAADAYQGVLKLRPRDTNAAANLALTAGQLAAVRKHYATIIGIPGHRGHQVGGELGQAIDNQRVTMDNDKEQTGPEVDLSSRQNTEQARLRSQVAAASAKQHEPDRAYPAALKKLELTADRPAQVQKELLKLDAADSNAGNGELLPW
ncbi:VWA domain-containing protein [Sulfuriferula sp. AH1]|uniref:vWA domain-containing protein n=1 Tax=Sulfuriferula sp. AH1 TaxID=1985873 RepID=UPI001676ED42|nr:VWA domain-containing protein [Sulfuriferula sp. AH1]